MGWKILSQKGIEIGINASPQHTTLSILGTQKTTKTEIADDFGCCCKKCDAYYTSLTIYLDATNAVAPGHNCCDAEFCLFVLDYKKTNEMNGQKHWIFVKRANLNSTLACKNGANIESVEFDQVVVPDSVIINATEGKTGEQCCELEFLWVGAPFPDAVQGPEDYGDAVVDFQGVNWGPFKGGGNIGPRERTRVHGDITKITILDSDGEILKSEKFNANTTKIINVCNCPPGFTKDPESGFCIENQSPAQ